MPDNADLVERCPTCGQRVSVATGDEGTSHFVREAEVEAEGLRTTLEAIHRIALMANATQEWVEPRAILRLADIGLERP